MIYDIFYNDGAYLGTVEFDESCAEDFVEHRLLRLIEENNENPNSDYHITMKNVIRRI